MIADGLGSFSHYLFQQMVRGLQLGRTTERHPLTTHHPQCKCFETCEHHDEYNLSIAIACYSTFF